jgi:hypothetical protein
MTLRLLSAALLLSGCARSAGLEELDALPEGFPLKLEGEIGNITRSKTAGQVSADLVFELEPAAREGYAGLLAQVHAKHWKTATPSPGKRKWEVEAFDLPDQSRLELGCCPARADRRHVVLVSWWPKSP